MKEGLRMEGEMVVAVGGFRGFKGVRRMRVGAKTVTADACLLACLPLLMCSMVTMNDDV